MTVIDEISAVLGTFLASVLVYLITNWIQQKSRKNNVINLLSYVYRPLYYFINLKYDSIVTYMLLLTSIFFAVLSLISHFLGTVSNIILSIISYVIFLILILILIEYSSRSKKIISILVKESQYNVPDMDGLRIRWNNTFKGISSLVVKYFLLILALTFMLTIIFMVIDKDFEQVGISILFADLFSILISLVFYKFFTRGINVSLFDRDIEIELKLFDLIKDPAYCVCVIDNSGNEYCGNLENISYGIVIKQNDGTIVNIPYELVSKAKSCPKSRNTSSIPQPYQ
ncbi:hypothetical protein [Saccharolobus islandicus]|uniref:Uncharacterized protein n=1 Tax=Saccharolobus islandicus (strain M.16.27) TaxID=427318 RepID=C3N604_SACI3|nr:hypothetical protein [Sulfolobus islandicus]ACP55429.1 hypothetical protein M1627_1545 [Sulfolobus islandicus M.16.27]